MASKTIGGISGVLGKLISSAPAPAGSSGHQQAHPPVREIGLPRTPCPLTASQCRSTRLGRPPNGGRQKMVPKQKVTIRVSTELIDEYRHWSWKAKCQLGELVERALLACRDSHSGCQ